MKITKSQLKQIIKEELGSFFSAEREEEEAASAATKREFREFRDKTLEQITFLRELQRDKKTLNSMYPYPNQRAKLSEWHRMLSKLIQGLERNLEVVTGSKGTPSGAEPLSEGNRYYRDYSEWLESILADKDRRSPKHFCRVSWKCLPRLPRRATTLCS